MRSIVNPSAYIMSGNPVVRAAQPTDAAALQSLYRQLVDDENVHVAAAQIQLVSEDARTRLFVCEIDGNAEATVLVSLCTDVMYGDQPFAVVENLVVDKAHRGKGIGQALLRQVEQFCLSRNCSKMMLFSSVIRVDAHRFFERVGFRSDLKRGFSATDGRSHSDCRIKTPELGGKVYRRPVGRAPQCPLSIKSKGRCGLT